MCEILGISSVRAPVDRLLMGITVGFIRVIYHPLVVTSPMTRRGVDCFDCFWTGVREAMQLLEIDKIVRLPARVFQ